MNAVAQYNTLVSVESRVPALALFEKLREILRIDPHTDAIEYSTELYFANDEDSVVQLSMEFGEGEGSEPLFIDDSDDDDEYVSLHTPYAEVTLSTNADFKTSKGGGPKDLHALILSELSEWFDDHSIEWGYYSDADSLGRLTSGEYPVKFGNPDKADWDDLLVQ